MLSDKDARAVAGALGDAVDLWYAAGLSGPRGRGAEQLASDLRQQFPGRPVSAYADVASAWRAAMAAARSGDRVIAFGSFLTAREALLLET